MAGCFVGVYPVVGESPKELGEQEQDTTIHPLPGLILYKDKNNSYWKGCEEIGGTVNCLGGM